MVLSIKTTLRQAEKIKSSVPLALYDPTISGLLSVSQYDPTCKSYGNLNTYYDIIFGDAYLEQVLRYKNFYTYFNQFLEYLETYSTLEQIDPILKGSTSLQLIPGSHRPWLNPRKYYATLRQNETYDRLITQVVLGLTERSHRQVINFFKFDDTLSSGVSLNQIDTYGPRPVNISPGSGTVFNNPLAPITFNYIDAEGNNVVNSSIFIYINNTLIISGGLNTTPPGSGTATLTQITPQNYLFNFIPSLPFSDDHPVIVSGSAIDNHIPSNSGNFSYTYQVWSTSDLQGQITGTPDSYSPYLYNLSPSNLQIEVPTNTNINLEIRDDHTGVDPSSVIIEVDGEVIVSGGILVSQTFGSISITSTYGGRGVAYSINPTRDFMFNYPVLVRVYAKDRYTPAVNILDTNYMFTTFSNSHLVVSGLEMLVSGTWTACNIDGSYPIETSGVQFRTKYFNLEGTDLNLSNSCVKLNNSIIPATFTEVVSGTEYDVHFNLTPDYTTDADLNFYIEQLPQPSGVSLFNNFYTTLLWGMEYCYDDDKKLSYLKDIPVTVQVYNYGDKARLNALVYSFQTLPMPSIGLYGEIYPISPPSSSIGGIIDSINPYFEYGKTMEFEVSVKDFAGNLLNYKWKFKLENG